MNLVKLRGALCLVRMKPILEMASTPFLVEIDSIVAACSMHEAPDLSAEVGSLREWRCRIGMLDDSLAREYFQSTAAGIAILVAEPHEITPTEVNWRISSSVANFWDSCDDILHRTEGYSRGELVGIKTTLRGVEDIWRDRDFEILASQADPRIAFLDRLAKIQSNVPRRVEVARIVADCAGWL